jgi:hypothetical protein
VTVDINVTNAPAFKGYEFSLFFDQKLLTLHSVNFGSGTMFTNPLVATNDNSTWGTIRESVVNLGTGGADNGTRFGFGILIQFVFSIKGLGASPFVLAAGTSQPAEGAGATEGDWTRLVYVNNQFIDVSTSDGYFQNDPPKLGPVARFTFIPSRPLAGDEISFNATTSFDPDSSTSRVTRYFWDFGNGAIRQSSSPVQLYSYAPPSGAPLYGNFSVLLTVLDSDNNFTGMVTRLVDIQRVVLPPPPPSDFALSVSVANGAFVTAGESLFSEVQLVNVGSVLFNGNVALTGQVSPVEANGPTVSFNPGQINLGGFSGSPFSVLTVSTNSATPPLQYTITVTGTSGALIHTGVFELTVLPAPTLTLDPSSGSLGTLVTVHGSGFGNNPPGQFSFPVEVEMTFDNQLLGNFIFQGSSFNFTFDVPHAQAGLHKIHAIEQFPFLDVQADFTVLPEPGSLSVTLSVGTIYFPGDTATVFVLTSLNGQPTTVTSLQIVIVRPNGSSIVLNAGLATAGVYKASYAIPSTGPLGTYAVVVKAQQSGSGSASTIGSFEVKPTWLSANGRNLLMGTSIVGAVGVLGILAVAWRKGYFTGRKGEFPIP